jgi:hypothetical protein
MPPPVSPPARAAEPERPREEEGPAWSRDPGVLEFARDRERVWFGFCERSPAADAPGPAGLAGRLTQRAVTAATRHEGFGARPGERNREAPREVEAALESPILPFVLWRNRRAVLDEWDLGVEVLPETGLASARFVSRSLHPSFAVERIPFRPAARELGQELARRREILYGPLGDVRRRRSPRSPTRPALPSKTRGA